MNVQELKALNFTLYLTTQSLFLHRLTVPPYEGFRGEIGDLAGPREPPWEERPKTRKVAKSKWYIRTTAKSKGMIRKSLSGVMLKKDHCYENRDHQMTAKTRSYWE